MQFLPVKIISTTLLFVHIKFFNLFCYDNTVTRIFIYIMICKFSLLLYIAYVRYNANSFSLFHVALCIQVTLSGY